VSCETIYWGPWCESSSDPGVAYLSLKQAESPERTVDHHADLNRLGVSLQATSSLLIFLSLLKAAMEDLGLSARAHDKVLRVARTIADLEGHDDIKPQNIAEAVGYRSLDRSVWA
jgi:predicted ATPase with chaperone activity